MAPSPARDVSEYVGELVSRRSVEIFPQVAGYVQQIAVAPGEVVKQGALILKIDLRQEQASLAEAQAALAEAEAASKLAKQTHERSKELLARGLVSAQEYERAAAQADAAEARRRAARATVEARHVQLGLHAIEAPFGGKIGDVVVKVGDYVTPQTLLTTVDQSAALELSVHVPVERAKQIAVGQTPVEVLDGAGKLLVTAPVFFVAPRPQQDTQLIEVKAAIANDALGLRSGQKVRVRVVYGVSQALMLPPWAVTQQSGQAFVYRVVRENGAPAKVQRHPVTLGPLQDDARVVQAGLEAGDEVAVSHVQMLRDGQPIEPVAAAEDAGR